MRFFVLGANDPEMREIANVLKAAGEQFVYARYRGAVVRPNQAYRADGTSEPLPKGAQVVTVECRVQGLAPVQAIDHHNPGDAGFDCGPEQYLQGSSLGQLLTLMGKTPTAEQRIICAADHSPTQAYRGLCPGVLPEDLFNWRAQNKAASWGISVQEFHARVEAAHQELLAAERIDVAGTAVAWLPEANDYTPEASARYDIPFIYKRQERDGRVKVGLLGAPAEAISTYMRECGLLDVYGNPSRGYAGGYLA